MPNALLAFLSRDWAAIAIAAALVLLGTLLTVVLGPKLTGFAVALFIMALALAAGGLTHALRVAHTRRRNPPAGQMIDVGGYRVHMLAEGERRGHPSIVMFGGGHAAGIAMSHLHRALAATTRSILIDRPGTGWSDTGPFPRTTARESQEIALALATAGEQGPFVLVGYSFGGLLAANIARRHPELVATLVLLDPTPLETIVLGPRLGALREMRSDALKTAILRLVGFPVDLGEARVARHTAHMPARQNFETLIGPDLQRLKDIECGAGPQLARYSIYQELSPEGVAACAWETVVYDGDLGDLPVVLVAPGTAADVTSLPELQGAEEPEARRMQRFFERTRERYLATSTCSRRVYTPAGTTHQFVYETPDFVVATLREIVENTPRVASSR